LLLKLILTVEAVLGVSVVEDSKRSSRTLMRDSRVRSAEMSVAVARRLKVRVIRITARSMSNVILMRKF